LLTPPAPAETGSDGDFFSPLKVFDYLSPSKWVFDIVKSLTGVDILGELVSPFVGHWERVSAYGDALTKVSQCLTGVSTNVSNVNGALDTQWDGNAADAANVYFGSVGTSLRLHSEALAKAGERYQELAAGMYHHHVAAEHLLKLVFDEAIAIAVWAAVGTATAETGVGAAVGYGMAAYKTVRLVNLINHWRELVEKAMIGAEGFMGILYGLSRRIDDLGPIANVTEPYRHPSVRC